MRVAQLGPRMRGMALYRFIFENRTVLLDTREIGPEHPALAEEGLEQLAAMCQRGWRCGHLVTIDRVLAAMYEADLFFVPEPNGLFSVRNRSP